MGKKLVNTLWTGDNLYILNGMNSESVDLIYLDPPFNSKRTYSAPVGSVAAGSEFNDMWTWDDVDLYFLEGLYEKCPPLIDYIKSIGAIHGKGMMSYAVYMAQRIVEMHRVMKPTGSFYLHCDPTASHYLKIILDSVFGKNNFRNEIIWHYKGAAMTAVKSRYPRKHDVILLYTKSGKYTFNPPRESDLSDQMKKRWDKHLASDRKSILWGSIKNEPGQVRKFKESLTRKLGREPKDDDVAWTAKPSLIKSVWTDISEVRNNPKYKESTGYPTQKPLALLERIISASSNKGDMVLDPFCGCATTCVAATKLHRKWIGIDIEKNAVLVLQDRLEKAGEETWGFSPDKYVHRTDIPHRTDVVVVEPNASIKERLHKDQTGICKGCSNKYQIKDFHIDHIIPKSKGGGDYYENYQLLCGHCNTTKGNRPMEYLMKRLAEIAKKVQAFSF